ncbi:MAG: hypothetical protein NZ560_03830 [Aquificaceae bacterium]|nr:hypothetical protein [Aquificaceae bacterium]MDW8097487.1 hypothetical protein [Aquificaceae bacterium]
MDKLIAQFRALPQWQRLFLLVLVPFGLSVYVWYMLLSPAREEVRKFKVEIQTRKTEIQNIKASLNPALIENLKKEEARLRTELQLKEEEQRRLVGEIPKEGDVGLLLRNIGQVARRSGVVLLSMQVSSPQSVTYVLVEEGGRKKVIEAQPQQQPQQQQAQQQPQQKPQQAQPQNPPQGVSFQRIELKVSLTGSYPSVKDFINNLRKEGVISYPTSLSITPEGSQVKAEITIQLLMKGGEP